MATQRDRWLVYLDDLAPWEGPSEANPTGPSDTLQRLKGKDRVRVQRSLLLSRDNTLDYLDLRTHILRRKAL